MIFKIPCLLRLHRWAHTPAVYSSYTFCAIALPDEPATRKCETCGKEQWLDEAVLGLNPPQYVKTWEDLK